MTTFSDMVYQCGGLPALSGVPFGPKSKYYFLDPVNGLDTNNGLSLEAPLKTLTAAYAKTVSGQNDVIFFINGATADNPASTLVWSKDFTHLIGISAPLPGEGQRCRIVGTAANALTNVLTVSGSGCVFANLKISNSAEANVDSGAVIVSGERNVFYNVMFAGMLHATPAGRAGSYSLTLSGSENLFERCTIGADTILRTAANAELVVSGGARNKFWDCEFVSASDTAGHFAVKISNMDRYIQFKDCLFYNFSVNWAQSLTDAFNVTASATHYIIQRGNCQFVGYTGVADVVTHVYGAGAAPNAGMFLSTNPTT